MQIATLQFPWANEGGGPELPAGAGRRARMQCLQRCTCPARWAGAPAPESGCHGDARTPPSRTPGRA
eukprot:5967030-Pyramimonas_sp.AAC.1